MTAGNVNGNVGGNISIRGLHKSYGRFEALKGVDLDVAGGEVLVVVGPSRAFLQAVLSR